VESAQAIAALESFAARMKLYAEGKELPAQRSSFSFFQSLRMLFASVVILSLLAAGSQVSVGTAPEHALVRVAGRFPGVVKKNCRKPKPEELMSGLAHMQKLEICDEHFPSYTLEVFVDEKRMLTRHLSNPSRRTDRPLFLNEDIIVPVGQHSLRVHMEAEQQELAEELRFHCSVSRHFSPGRIALIRYCADERRLICDEQPEV
jgi:hypothetical protein